MTYYDDETRGTFQCEEKAKQLISFDGMFYKGRNGFRNVTPTDIDGLVQLDSCNCFLIFELKHSDAKGLSRGQADALKEMCDAIQDGGRNAAFFIAFHNVEVPETIMAKDALVPRFYYKKTWYRFPSDKMPNLYYATEWFINSFLTQEEIA